MTKKYLKLTTISAAALAAMAPGAASASSRATLDQDGSIAITIDQHGRPMLGGQPVQSVLPAEHAARVEFASVNVGCKTTNTNCPCQPKIFGDQEASV
jgi:hypothetical protein